MVDDEDYPMVSRVRWHLDGNGYARGILPESGRRVLMHRYVMSAPADASVDHRDGNRLNNCRSNLRIATRAQNALNRGAKAGRKVSLYKGVEWDWLEQKWRAVIAASGVRHRSPHFVFENDAARYYNMMAKHYHGKFARLNDVPVGLKGRRYPDDPLTLEFE
jgi:hypothetical protein